MNTQLYGLKMILNDELHRVIEIEKDTESEPDKTFYRGMIAGLKKAIARIDGMIYPVQCVETQTKQPCQTGKK